MRSDPGAAGSRRRRVRRRLRVALRGTGLLVTALATTYALKTGASAGQEVTGENGRTTPRTVIATVGTERPAATAQAVTAQAVNEAADPAAALERPVQVPTPVAIEQSRVDLRTVVYTVAGNQRPDDPVTVIYADETGTLQTLENVTMPWTLTMTPALPVSYIYAKSRGSQLNCWITDAAGATVASRTDYTPTTSCNR